jgi:hypothetical protein
MSSRSATPDDPHLRARHALAELAAGVLEESDHAWLSGHLAACAECRRLSDELDEHARELEDEPGHLPARLVSRWTREAPRLPDVVREQVWSHLRQCERCAGELAMLGHDWRELLGEPRAARTRSEPRPGLWRKLRESRRSLWILGGGLATAATFLVLQLSPLWRGTADRVVAVGGSPPPVIVAPDSSGHDTTAPATRPPAERATRRAPAGEVPLAFLGGDTDALTAPELSLDQPTFRSGAGSDSVLAFDVDRGTRPIRMRHPTAALLVEDQGEPVLITLITPSGETLRAEGRVADLRLDRPLVLRRAQGIEAGLYRYRYEFGRGDREPPLSGQARIRVR